jgi:hypothetical protein
MKTFLSLLAALTVSSSAQSAAAPKWYQTSVKTKALLYDTTGNTIDFDTNNVFPVSRILNQSELTAVQKAELAPSKEYFVIPMSSGYCAIVPVPPGDWVEPTNPKFVREITDWKGFDLQAAAKVKELQAQDAEEAALAAKQPADSTIRYRQRKAERDAKAKAAADLATQYQIANSLESLSQTLRNLELRRQQK